MAQHLLLLPLHLALSWWHATLNLASQLYQCLYHPPVRLYAFPVLSVTNYKP